MALLVAPHHSLPTGIGDLSQLFQFSDDLTSAPHHSLPTGIGDGVMGFGSSRVTVMGTPPLTADRHWRLHFFK